MAREVTFEQGDAGELSVHDWLSVHNAVRDFDPISVESALHVDANTPWSQDVIGRLDGVPVGVGYVAPRLLAQDADDAMLVVCVLPEHRRRGVGTEIYRRLSDRARMQGKRGFKTW